MKLVQLLLVVTAAMTGCEQCMVLSDHHFDYLYLIQQNVCGGEIDCERALRDIAFRYFNRHTNVRLCETRETSQECLDTRTTLCTELVGDPCSHHKSSETSAQDDSVFNKILYLRGSLKKLNSEASEIQRELNTEIASEREKYESLLSRLSSLQELP